MPVSNLIVNLVYLIIFLFLCLALPPPPPHPFSRFPTPLCTQVPRPCPATWPTSGAPRRRRTWWTRRRRKTRRRRGTEVASTLKVGEATAKCRPPPPPATRRPARESSPPGSRSTGTVSAGIELAISRAYGRLLD